MGAAIEFYFDFSSPYGYIASELIEKLASKHGREVSWNPTLLGVVFKQSGNQPLIDQPLKGTYSRHDMDRTARLYGIPFQLPDPFPFIGVVPSRALLWVKDAEPDMVAKAAQQLFRAAFRRNAKISDAEVVAEELSKIGIDAAAVRSAMQDPSIKERLREAVDRSISVGVCGSPFFIVDGEPFWGQDRMDQLDRWLATGGW